MTDQPTQPPEDSPASTERRPSCDPPAPTPQLYAGFSAMPPSLRLAGVAERLHAAYPDRFFSVGLREVVEVEATTGTRDPVSATRLWAFACMAVPLLGPDGFVDLPKKYGRLLIEHAPQHFPALRLPAGFYSQE